MAHIDNRSTLLHARRMLMGIGLNILDRVKVRGADLAIDPLTPVKSKPQEDKHQAITINVLRNGKPSDDEKVIALVAEGIEEIIEGLHPSERDAVTVKGLTISMKAAEEVVKAKAPKELPPRGSTNRRGAKPAAAPQPPPEPAPEPAPGAEGSTNAGTAAE